MTNVEAAKYLVEMYAAYEHYAKNYITVQAKNIQKQSPWQLWL